MDEKEIKIGKKLDEELVHGILDSEIFIACINKDYVKSEACYSEISYANNLNKMILPLMFESLKPIEFGTIGYIVLKLLRLHLFEDSECTKSWSGPMSNALTDAIKSALKYERSKPNIHAESESFCQKLAEENNVN